MHAASDSQYPMFVVQMRRSESLRAVARLIFRVTTVFGLGLFISIAAPDITPRGAEILLECTQGVAVFGYAAALLVSVAAEYCESHAAEELLHLCAHDSTRHPRLMKSMQAESSAKDVAHE